MAATRTPPETWIEEGLRALAAGGPDAVRIELLAKALGVTKGGFYWHFDGRDELLEEMLETWERVAVDEAIESVEGGGGDDREKLRRLFRPGLVEPEPDQVDLAVRDWARRDTRVAERLSRIDNRRMSYMRTLFGGVYADADKVEVHATLAFSLFVGSHFMAVDHAGRDRRQALELAMAWLLRQH